MGKQDRAPTPAMVATALGVASDDAQAAGHARAAAKGGGRATHPDGGFYVDWETAQECAAVSLAAALVLLQRLRLVDPRADFGTIHQVMLEYLPRLVADGDNLVGAQLLQVSVQLKTLAGHVAALATPTPKPLDIAGAIDAEADTMPGTRVPQ